MEQLEAGIKAESTGIYKVVHANKHTSNHYVFVFRGDTLPG
jgi:hypothetical protein